ncbi:MAG: hypothetical protein IPJ79_14705 [Bacteroidetes bacterium]|nr:hypothetical protein [Bacteroidota bacterium]HNR19552.1 hypothetical protein [Bacteroidia bacterium]HNU33478.1 hypothetical protein [Bacteroidia bacterium]
MKKLFLLIPFLLPLFSLCQSQIDSKPTDIYQIKLEKPVKCIQKIEYEKTGEEIKGWLDDDRKIIYLENYRVNNRVKVKVIYDDDNEEQMLRSACSVQLSQQKVL